MEFLLEENALLRDTLKRIVQNIHNAGGAYGFDDYAKGWDDAITEALTIIEQESGVTIDEILQPKCN